MRSGFSLCVTSVCAVLFLFGFVAIQVSRDTSSSNNYIYDNKGASFIIHSSLAAVPEKETSATQSLLSASGRVFISGAEPEPLRVLADTERSQMSDLFEGYLAGNPTVVEPAPSATKLRCTYADFLDHACVSQADQRHLDTVASAPNICVFFHLANHNRMVHSRDTREHILQHDLADAMRSVCFSWARNDGGAVNTFLFVASGRAASTVPNGLFDLNHWCDRMLLRRPGLAEVATSEEMWTAVRGLVASNPDKVSTCKWFVNASLGDVFVNARQLSRNLLKIEAQLDPNDKHKLQRLVVGTHATVEEFAASDSSSFFALHRSALGPDASPRLAIDSPEVLYRPLDLALNDPQGLRAGQDIADGNPCLPCYSVIDRIRPSQMMGLARQIARSRGRCTLRVGTKQYDTCARKVDPKIRPG
eukprot:PhM_4_TR2644/c0_g1_i1/m.76423